MANIIVQPKVKNAEGNYDDLVINNSDKATNTVLEVDSSIPNTYSSLQRHNNVLYIGDRNTIIPTVKIIWSGQLESNNFITIELKKNTHYIIEWTTNTLKNGYFADSYTDFIIKGNLGYFGTTCGILLSNILLMNGGMNILGGKISYEYSSQKLNCDMGYRYDVLSSGTINPSVEEIIYISKIYEVME